MVVGTVREKIDNLNLIFPMRQSRHIDKAKVRRRVEQGFLMFQQV